MPIKYKGTNRRPKGIQSVCKAILGSHSDILSVLVTDSKGKILGRAFGAEYRRRSYFQKASQARERSGLLNAVLFGMEDSANRAFGDLEVILRVHGEASIMIIPTRSKKKIFNLLCKKRASPQEILPHVQMRSKGL